MSEARPRRKLVVAIVVLATVIGLLAIFAVWAKRQLLETDTWVDTSTELLDDSEIQDALSGFLVDALYSSVDVEGELRAKLPPQVQALAGPAAGGLRELADDLALRALQSPRVQQLWADANRQAHGTLISVVEGGGEVVTTEGGDVTLDLGTIVEELGQRVGIDVTGKVPPEVAQIQILKADQLSAAQDGVNLLRKLAWGLTLVALALYALAIYLARGWRREATRAVGWGFAAIGLLALVIRSVAGGYLVSSLAGTTSVEPAVQSAWSIGTSLLHDSGVAMIAYGLVIVAGTWLAGPGSIASEARRGLTPFMERRAIGYAFLALIVILVLWWNPTPGTSRLAPSLLLVLLLVAGFEALRRQAVRDFPDASWEGMREGWRERGAAIAERVRERRAAKPGGSAAAPAAAAPRDRIEQLERLARLRESGILTQEELEREKKELLTAP